MLEKLIEALKGLTAEDKAKFGDTLRSTDPALYQGIFQSGFDTGYGKGQGEIKTAKDALAAADAKLVEATGEIAKLKANPDSAALHTQYGSEITKIKGAHADEITKLRGQIEQGARDSMIGDLKGALASGDKVLDPAYLAVIASSDAVRSRIKINPDGTRQVLQKGKDIPFAVTSPDEAIKLLADEIKGETDPKFLVARTDGGAGTPSNGAANGTPKGTVFEQVRASVKADEDRSKLGGNGAKPVGAFSRLAADAE